MAAPVHVQAKQTGYNGKSHNSHTAFISPPQHHVKHQGFVKQSGVFGRGGWKGVLVAAKVPENLPIAAEVPLSKVSNPQCSDTGPCDQLAAHAECMPAGMG